MIGSAEYFQSAVLNNSLLVMYLPWLSFLFFHIFAFLPIEDIAIFFVFEILPISDLSISDNFVFDLFLLCFEVVFLTKLIFLDFSDNQVLFLSWRKGVGVEYLSLSSEFITPFNDMRILLLLFPRKAEDIRFEQLLFGLICSLLILLAGKYGGSCWLLSIDFLWALLCPFSLMLIASAQTGKISVFWVRLLFLDLMRLTVCIKRSLSSKEILLLPFWNSFSLDALITIFLSNNFCLAASFFSWLALAICLLLFF